MKNSASAHPMQGVLETLSRLRPASVKAGLVLMLHAGPLTMAQWAAQAGMAQGTLLSARAELEALGLLRRDSGQWLLAVPDPSKSGILNPHMNDMNDFKQELSRASSKIIHSFKPATEPKNRNLETPAPPAGLEPVLEQLQELGAQPAGLRSAMRNTPFRGEELVEVARAIVDTLLARPKDFTRPGGFAVTVLRDPGMARGVLSEARTRWKTAAKAKASALEVYERAKVDKGSGDPDRVYEARERLIEILWRERGEGAMAKIQREIAEGLQRAPASVRERALKHQVEVRLLHDAGMEV